MQLSDLTAYAAEKYHILEQHKWSDFPGFSVLTDPDTGKWVALLMREWDSDLGENIERCDIKCGKEELSEYTCSFLCPPFRMHGPKWTGVDIRSDTDPKIVFDILERAIKAEKEQGFTFTFRESRCKGEPSLIQPASKLSEQVPEMIRKMTELYDYGDGSFKQKCKNFYTQGMFMKDYEDSAPWYGDIRLYFPAYHDLNLKQLRGYFTWRSRARKGEFVKTCSTFVYIYIYELLNGIGTSSVEESLKKLKDFQTGYIDTGMGDMFIKGDLRRWMMELSILNRSPVDFAKAYMDPGTLERDQALSILRRPEEYGDSEVFDALMKFSGPRTSTSPVRAVPDDRGKQLFAEIWRLSASSCVHREGTDGEGSDLFTICFGRLKEEPWHPLANAIYCGGFDEDREHDEEDFVFELSGCRKYIRRSGAWTQVTIDNLTADRYAFLGFMHAADLRLRRKLKTGHYLREKKDEAWAYACIDTALEEIRRAEIEAARPKVSIDVSGLDKIREDADVTRDSLLTEDEMDEPEPDIEEASADAVNSLGLDRTQLAILQALLDGNDVSALIEENRLMPEVTADAINEVLFDDIGDSVVDCSGDSLSLVEDYRDDIELLIGGTENE